MFINYRRRRTGETFAACKQIADTIREEGKYVLLLCHTREGATIYQQTIPTLVDFEVEFEPVIEPDQVSHVHFDEYGEAIPGPGYVTQKAKFIGYKIYKRTKEPTQS